MTRLLWMNILARCSNWSRRGLWAAKNISRSTTPRREKIVYSRVQRISVFSLSIMAPLLLIWVKHRHRGLSRNRQNTPQCPPNKKTSIWPNYPILWTSACQRLLWKSVRPLPTINTNQVRVWPKPRLSARHRRNNRATWVLSMCTGYRIQGRPASTRQWHLECAPTQFSPQRWNGSPAALIWNRTVLRSCILKTLCILNHRWWWILRHDWKRNRSPPEWIINFKHQRVYIKRRAALLSSHIS